jgi:signal transduction histidine kinase
VASRNEILLERLRSVFQQVPSTLLITVINAALIAVFLVSRVHDRRAYIWLGLVVLVSGIRLASWLAFRRANPVAENTARWALVSEGGAVASGLTWGIGALVLLPPYEQYQLMWVLVVGGMCAGAATLHAAHLATALAFVVPAALPLTVWFVFRGSGVEASSALLVATFLVALALNSRRSSNQLGYLINLRFDLNQRTADLDRMEAKMRREIAEHAATIDKLKHAQKLEAMGQLTAGISHDFNNLLTAILGSLELLKTRLPPDPRIQRLLENATKGAERGALLTQRLLAFGRRQILDPAPVDVHALVMGMSGLLGSLLGAPIRIETHLPPVLPRVQVDAEQLELAILNLAANARDAMPAGGTFTISAREAALAAGEDAEAPAGAYVVLAFSDTGEGMDAATLRQAIEPFFTTKGVGRGTGLGLSMVHGLAAQSMGTLRLRSAPGAGTTVELWLPLALAAGVSAEAGAETEAAVLPPGLRVLVVDDDPLVLTYASAFLESAGLTALHAASGQEALDMLRNGVSVDLLITDYAMPGMNGMQLIAEFQRLLPGLPVLLATGYAELADPVPENVARLEKPYGGPGLMRAIARAVAS